MLEVSLSHSEPGPGCLRLYFPAQVKADNCSRLLHSLQQTLAAKLSLDLVEVDFSHTEQINDFAILLLLELKNQTQSRGVKLSLHNLRPGHEQVLHLVRFDQLQPGVCTIPKAKVENIFVRQGESFLRLIQDLRHLHEFIGGLVFSCLKLFLKPKKLRYRDLILYIHSVGVDALPIVGLISFLLGLIIAFMSSIQLKQFGADIYVASLVSLAMVKELGPIMTAILVAGRSGSSFAAEIGSMKISEEIDALTTMGLDINLFLVMPKMLASLMVVPILVLFSDIFGIAGGLVVGVGMLDLTIQGYINQTLDSLTLFDLVWSMFKSGIFALLIAWIGCFRGFQTQGGASGVGRSTTSAVVSGIFLIILVDSVLAVILTYWG